MSLLDLWFSKKKPSAILAKERLQIILAHERVGSRDNKQNVELSWLSDLQKELLTVVAKYINIDQDALKVHLEKRDNLELLEINVTLPEQIKIKH